MTVYRPARSFAWNAGHPPKLPARPRRLPAGPPVSLFGRQIECPVGISAGPLPNAQWIQAYARLGYGLLTYKTVRSVARQAFVQPNLVFCRLGEPSVAEARAPRNPDPAAITCPISTSSICAELTPARSTAALMATAPRCGASTAVSAPLNLPMGVRAPLKITTSLGCLLFPFFVDIVAFLFTLQTKGFSIP